MYIKNVFIIIGVIPDPLPDPSGLQACSSRQRQRPVELVHVPSERGTLEGYFFKQKGKESSLLSKFPKISSAIAVIPLTVNKIASSGGFSPL